MNTVGPAPSSRNAPTPSFQPPDDGPGAALGRMLVLLATLLSSPPARPTSAAVQLVALRLGHTLLGKAWAALEVWRDEVRFAGSPAYLLTDLEAAEGDVRRLEVLLRARETALVGKAPPLAGTLLGDHLRADLRKGDVYADPRGDEHHADRERVSRDVAGGDRDYLSASEPNRKGNRYGCPPNPGGNLRGCPPAPRRVVVVSAEARAGGWR